MYKMIRKQTRPSKDVPFFVLHESEAISQDMRTHFEAAFVLNNKFITVTEDLSPDELQLTISTFWNTKEDLDDFKADPVCTQMQQIADDYFASVGITVETVLETEVTL